MKAEVLTDNAWKDILSKVDINWNKELDTELYRLNTDEGKYQLNTVTDNIEEELIKLIMVIY